MGIEEERKWQRRITSGAAGYVRDILFQDEDERDLYIYRLKHHKLQFKILEEHTREDGSVIIRILQQHNTARLIQLYTE